MKAPRYAASDNRRELQDMKRIKDMVAEANSVVDNAPATEMMALHGEEGVTFVDLRDPRELEREGMIPGAFHCPRGMLEFWIDPESPYAKPQFQGGGRFVFYCASGWRSALAARTAQEMGLDGVSHVNDGFAGWKKAGGPTAERPKKG
jgi:rhodanese-related sulfurtransferase